MWITRIETIANVLQGATQGKVERIIPLGVATKCVIVID